MPASFRLPGAGGPRPGPADPASPARPRLRALGDRDDPRDPGGRRERSDRRAQPTPRLSRYALLGGRRRAVRRADEVEGSFVDRHGWRVVALVLWVAVLNAGDSFFTLFHLQNGGVELNPVAAAMLRSGRLGFVLWKSVLIALPLLILCVHKNFPLARLGLWTAAATYTALFADHLSLL